jgi:hypothetical protein
MNILDEQDRFLYIMDRLCEEVGEGRRPCPESEVLTAALRDLFPGGYFPAGTGVAVHDKTKSSWYVDIDTKVLPPNRPDVLRLRRELSRLLNG